MTKAHVLINISIGEVEVREVRSNDEIELGIFFESLTDTTRKLYGPHPLNAKQAKQICEHLPEVDKKRFIAIHNRKIIGYFLFDFDHYPNEFDRYAKLDLSLNFKIDPVFAPCISDDYQGKGIASNVMPYLMEWAKSNRLRSIVLMGGTQEPNKRARKFYQNMGFQEFSWFYTANNDVNNVDMRLVLSS
jgi:GNAT superfamily N-acetyltransferase